jgi:uncharacterized protein (DUF1697 family)
MVYVALLRGVNVGGNNTVDMRELKAVFEAAGMTSTRTYINSGNVIFSSDERNIEGLTRALELGIAARFGFEIGVLVFDVEEIAAIAGSIPAAWGNDEAQRCDVLFLWPDVDRPSIVEEMFAKPGIDDLRYAPGAVIWRRDRADATRSGILKLIGTPLYRRMTVRNCNTARKLLGLMNG